MIVEQPRTDQKYVKGNYRHSNEFLEINYIKNMRDENNNEIFFEG